MAEGKGAAPPRGSVPAPVPSPRAAIGSAKGGSGSVPARGVRDGASPCHARGSAGRCGIGAVCPHFGPVGGGGPPAELLRRPGVSSEGLSGASCGARTARTCPGAPGGRAALRCGRTAVPPPSHRLQSAGSRGRAAATVQGCALRFVLKPAGMSRGGREKEQLQPRTLACSVPNAASPSAQCQRGSCSHRCVLG